jgi:hypothetical protein
LFGGWGLAPWPASPVGWGTIGAPGLDELDAAWAVGTSIVLNGTCVSIESATLPALTLVVKAIDELEIVWVGGISTLLDGCVIIESAVLPASRLLTEDTAAWEVTDGWAGSDIVLELVCILLTDSWVAGPSDVTGALVEKRAWRGVVFDRTETMLVGTIVGIEDGLATDPVLMTIFDAGKVVEDSTALLSMILLAVFSGTLDWLLVSVRVVVCVLDISISMWSPIFVMWLVMNVCSTVTVPLIFAVIWLVYTVW